MDCERLDTVLLDVLYGELAPEAAPAVEAHLAACHACATKLGGFQRVQTAAKALPDLSPPPSRFAALLAEAQAAVQIPPAQAAVAPATKPAAPVASLADRFFEKLRFLLSPPLAAAAALLLVIGLSFYVSKQATPPALEQGEAPAVAKKADKLAENRPELLGNAAPASSPAARVELDGEVVTKTIDESEGSIEVLLPPRIAAAAEKPADDFAPPAAPPEPEAPGKEVAKRPKAIAAATPSEESGADSGGRRGGKLLDGLDLELSKDTPAADADATLGAGGLKSEGKGASAAPAAPAPLPTTPPGDGRAPVGGAPSGVASSSSPQRGGYIFNGGSYGGSYSGKSDIKGGEWIQYQSAVEKGDRAYSSQSYDEAAKSYRDAAGVAITGSVSYNDAVMKVAQAEAGAGRCAEAEAQARGITAGSEPFGTAMRAAATCFDAKGDTAEAIRIYEELTGYPLTKGEAQRELTTLETKRSKTELESPSEPKPAPDQKKAPPKKTKSAKPPADAQKKK